MIQFSLPMYMVKALRLPKHSHTSKASVVHIDGGSHQEVNRRIVMAHGFMNSLKITK